MAVLLGVWLVVSFCFVVFSFGLTDPNLVLSSWQPYWQFQQWSWQTFFLNREVLVVTYVLLLVALFSVYFLLVRAVRLGQLQRRQLLALCVGSVVMFSLSYNALSHDIFNYMFNARMVVKYDVNPHVTTALWFPYDPWTRFMHNTHTTAPYGYLWTGISVVVYQLGMGKFLVTWLLFKGMGVISYLLLLWVYVRLYGRQHAIAPQTLAVLFLNPLVLIEVASSAHNDLWMLVPALVSFWMLMKPKLTTKTLVLAGSLLLLSLLVKVATVVLVPLWLLLVIVKLKIVQRLPKVFQKMSTQIVAFWPDWASLVLFVPLLTERSQYFHPWYLLWSLVWLPLLRWQPWKIFLLALSMSSLLRYVPWLWAGGFPPEVLLQQKLTTWLPAVLVTIGVLGMRKRQQQRKLA